MPPRQCTDCHVNNNYNLTSTACVSCHQTDYNNATTPVNHVAAGFPTTCETCHDTVLWTDGKFNHTTTGFQLTGAHTVPPRQCTDCHVNNNYALNSTLCYSCHQKDYAGTNNPAHAVGRIPDDVRTLPRHDGLDGLHLQPQQHGIPADRLAHLYRRGCAPIATSTTTTRRCRQRASAAIRRTTTTRQIRATRRSRSSSRPLPELPQHDGLDWSDVQSHAVHAIPDESWQCE